MTKPLDKMIIQLNNEQSLLSLLNDEQFSAKVKDTIMAKLIQRSLDSLWRSEGRYELEEHIEKFLNKRYDMDALLKDWTAKKGKSDSSKRIKTLMESMSDSIDSAMEEHVKSDRFAFMVKDTMNKYTKHYMAAKVREHLDSPEFKDQIKKKAASVLLNQMK